VGAVASIRSIQQQFREPSLLILGMPEAVALQREPYLPMVMMAMLGAQHRLFTIQLRLSLSQEGAAARALLTKSEGQEAPEGTAHLEALVLRVPQPLESDRTAVMIPVVEGEVSEAGGRPITMGPLVVVLARQTGDRVVVVLAAAMAAAAVVVVACRTAVPEGVILVLGEQLLAMAAGAVAVAVETRITGDMPAVPVPTVGLQSFIRGK
jgi:hypothetical protein